MRKPHSKWRLISYYGFILGMWFWNRSVGDHSEVPLVKISDVKLDDVGGYRGDY